MKKTVYFILLSAATFLISCASNTTGIDAYTETLYKPSYASGFEIVGAEGRQSTLLKVFNPWQGAENTETTLFIVRNGEKIPAGFTGQVVKAGARRIVCLSSTYVAMLDALGQVDRVVGVSGRNYISNKYVTTHPEAVADIGFDGNIDYELLLAQRPDLVLLFGVSGASGMESKICCRTGHSVLLHRRVPRRVAARQGRMAGGHRRDHRQPRKRRSSLRAGSRTLRCAPGKSRGGDFETSESDD